jgi:predicted alpha/beta-fold hydrolase
MLGAGPLHPPFLDFPPFRPHALVPGGHLQTIFGCYLPSETISAGIEHRVPLPDGDHIVLHDDGPASFNPEPEAMAGPPNAVASGSRLNKRPIRIEPAHAISSDHPSIALLLHGLGGCHQSTYMQRCSIRLRAKGIRVFRMDLRGCGAGIKLARHPIHAGRSEDARAALDYVGRQCPGAAIHLVGFSMGANIVLKLAGELGESAPPYLASVLAVGPPIDLIECSKNMQRGWNRLYDRRFARNLVRFIQRRTKLVPDAHSRPLVPRPTSLLDFDAMFTAPLSGFADTDDYYQRASSGPLLPRICVPTLIIAAASDPIIPVQPFERASYSSTTQLLITPCGGHLGFVAARGDDPDHRWLDWRIVEWVTAQGKNSRTEEPKNQRPEFGRTAAGAGIMKV